MSIDSFTDTDAINIKDLVIEDESRKGFFPDWQVEITTDDWIEINNNMKFNQDAAAMYPFMQTAQAINILDPERAADIDLSDVYYDTIRSILRSRRDERILSFRVMDLSLASDAKLLFPDKNIVHDVDLSPEFVLSKIADRSYDPYDFAEGVIDYAILFPDKLDELNAINIHDQLFANTNSSNNVDGIASNTALRLAFPDKYQTPDNFSFARWRQAIEARKRHGSMDYLKYAAYLKILAATDVKLNEAGLELTMPTSEFTPHENSKMPERRNF